MVKKSVMVILSVVIFAGITWITPAISGGYPEKPISIIVPYKPGGGTDSNARVIEKYAKKYLGVPAAIINKPGAAGAVGYTELSTSKPDGYTIGYTNLPNMIKLVLDGNVHFKLEDFEPIIGQVKEKKLIAVTSKSRFKTIEDLVEYAKDNAGKLNGATSGPGSHNEMVLKAFCDRAGIKLVFIPFKGDSGMKTALLGGHADVMARGTSSFSTDQFRALMIFSKTRDKEMPRVPTSFEKGYKLDMATHRVLQAPKGTSRERIAYLEEKLSHMFADPEYLKDMKKIGAKTRMMTSKELVQLIRQERELLLSFK
jgi:tripartite-type tricarboxylate transporter receptor subunit TctC